MLGSAVCRVLQVNLFSHFWLFTVSKEDLAKSLHPKERSANPVSNMNESKEERELNATN